MSVFRKKADKIKNIIKKIDPKHINLAIILLLLFLSFSFGYQRGSQNILEKKSPISVSDAVLENKFGGRDNSVDFSLFWNVWDLLKSKYVDSDKLDAQNLVYGAIKGMLQATGDPYTTFFNPEENKKFGEDISGNFEGIGAELGVKNGILTVVAPLQGTPADKAGLRAGDKIIKIDGKAAGDMSIESAVDHIRGAKDTAVVLTIFREGSRDTEEISIVRNIINVKSVNLLFKENNIVSIEITRFGEDTEKGFSSAVSRAVSSHPRGLIIDLRNNPGGYLETAIATASKLIPKGKIVVIEEGSNEKQDKMYTRGGDVASTIETVVLINEGSASASEILAGAMKENRGNVTLMGKKSFGKGSVQEFIKTSQGTAAKITVAHWLTPNGNQINELGIKPDIEVDLTNEDYTNGRDPQMDAAVKYLQEKNI
ncbi:MAG: S41 family peptidase [Candidatus Moranbacteria bacterium]|nr:S41 family peptidase [Candidatus Moranbacteria bacterium]